MNNKIKCISGGLLCFVLLSIITPVYAFAQSQPLNIPRTASTAYPTSSGGDGFRYDWSDSKVNSHDSWQSNGHIGRHVVVMSASYIRQRGYNNTMDFRWRIFYTHSPEPVGDQYLQYRNGEKLLPVIEPVFENDKLVGEVLHYTPRVEDFYIVSEYTITKNDRLGRYLVCWYNASLISNFAIQRDGVRAPARTYDSQGNFEYDKHSYPFEYAYKISVAQYQAGYTAAQYAAGVKPPANIPQSPSEQPSSWAAGEVDAALKAELVPQSLQSRYTAQITRAEYCALAVMLYEKYTGEEIKSRMTFSDTNDVNVEKIASVGVVEGAGDGRFNPNDLLNREQAATMLSRLANALGKPLQKRAAVFNDINSVSAWAVEGTGQVQAAGIMTGIDVNTFAPKNPYTREQSIITMIRLWDIIS